MTSIFKLTLAEFKALKLRPDMLAFAKACDGDMRRFWNTCPNGEWLLWLLQKTQNLDELKARKVALAYAKKVLPVFEKVNPFDKNPRRCVRAIESFIKNPTVANQRLMMDAAYEIYANLTAAPCFRHPSGSNKGKHTHCGVFIWPARAGCCGNGG